MLRRLLTLATVASTALSADCSIARDSGYACADGQSSFPFFYDSRSKHCQPFSYRGCGGNSNRFPSREECLRACSAPSNSSSSSFSSTGTILTSPGSQWLQAERCGSNYLIPNHRYIPCTNGGCPDNHSCTGDICCPSKEYVCSLRDDTGSFAEGIEDKPRFGWSDSVNSCVRFSYYGANGNYNNFPNFYSCIRYCKP